MSQVGACSDLKRENMAVEEGFAQTLTAQQAMQILERKQPGLYAGSVRTLQRWMSDWRIAHA
jgi:hypothetical protein